jgi:hypothetical protein
MRITRFIIRKALIRTAVASGILIGILSFSGAMANTYENPNLGPAPVYPTNENGETYGSSAHANSLETEPDLIAAVGIDGTKGYLRKTDLYMEMPKTPEEALAKQRNQKILSNLSLDKIKFFFMAKYNGFNKFH